ncbi:D-psicose/D-tagatose/L-ribulose 3-epimerase [Cohaesibacter sp. ES.047]|uniref:sugar phosphate isomerase/epimerase family protein n=1 Tax=Cohaesibacter sp. ES.047 TaxID=1798205 RepID=UPI000BB992AD|nr:sugar phosphate isomerase/epimerase [Cohaesibacter sp. ES.047]SNY92234.1 D-psicose/D-tagatose/L-ribulose 3-epimerase [Cohaesibacter sp. ES.047]
MEGFGVHTSMWTMNWDREGAERAVAGARKYNVDFIEIPLLRPHDVDTEHTKALIEANELRAVCSLGLPEECWASAHPEKAIDYLKVALDKTKALGGEALSGVIYGGIGERTGVPPTQGEYDNVARVMVAAAAHAKKLGLELGIEAVNRYENHLINTARQATDLVERVGAENVFVHLDTYHMNIEEKGFGNGILDAREHLKYIHLSESDRGTPGEGTCGWDEIYATLKAIDFKGGLAMESFINMPPEIAYGLSVWRPVANSHDEVMTKGLSFLRNKAEQYRLI